MDAPTAATVTVHAAQSVVTIGQTGAWVGPLLVGLTAAGLDYSAIGPTAWRDRLAVAGYYAAAISFVYLLGLAQWEQAAFAGNYNWRMLGACTSLATHGALLLSMFGTLIGPTRTLANAVAGRVHFLSEDSKKAKVNQTLLGWSVAAAVTAPLSGTGGWGGLVSGIASLTTGMWSGVVTVVMHWLGG
jgi:hypothetical protein